jgi:hypothetical protein
MTRLLADRPAPVGDGYSIAQPGSAYDVQVSTPDGRKVHLFPVYVGHEYDEGRTLARSLRFIALDLYRRARRDYSLLVEAEGELRAAATTEGQPAAWVDRLIALADWCDEFRQWQATRREAEGAAFLDETGGDLIEGETPRGYVYSPGWIERRPVGYWLLIENMDWLDADLGKLERRLFNLFARDEIKY